MKPASQARYSLPFVGLLTAAVGLVGGWIAGAIVLLALIGAPLFAIMGGASIVAWLSHKEAQYHHLRFIAAEILTDRFSDSPILITIPLFTFLGYVLAESKTPDRLVGAASAMLGWLPGGLAIVCIVASAIFTVLTGASGVTIVAIGGLLYPALRKQGYSDRFALGLVTTGGSLGLLLPMSLPILVYALVAQIDINKAFLAVLPPGILVLVLLALYAAWVGKKEGVRREPLVLSKVLAALWELKWELGIPLLILAKLATDPQIDEAAGLATAYTFIFVFFIRKELSIKRDLARIAKSSMGLAGAVILILSMANALINYVSQEKIPDHVLNFMLRLGLTQTWQFLIVLNVFLLVLGMVMDGFSAILVAVPLIVPFAARFALGPFHLAMIFLLNLEIAYCCPPLGLNLFISSFRFNRPVVSLYRIVLPFAGILTIALMIVSYVPWLSNVTIQPAIEKARAEALRLKQPPREAWILECVQEDRLNPQPCSESDRKAFPHGQPVEAPKPVEEKKPEEKLEEADEALLQQMMGRDGGTDGSVDDDEELLKKMMGGGEASDGGAKGGLEAGAASEKKELDLDEDELFKKMMK